MWGADWKFRHEGNYLACRVMPNSCPEGRNFFNSHMDSFSCILFLRNYIYAWKCVILSNLRSNNYIFYQNRFGSVPFEDVDIEMFGGKWRQDVQDDVKTSRSSFWRYARELSYTPHVRQHFLAPVGFTEIPVGYARKRGSYTCGHFVWHLWNSPKAHFINIIWNDCKCKILFIIWIFNGIFMAIKNDIIATEN